MDNFKNRRRMAWISFAFLLLILIVSMIGITISNESIVSAVVVCLTSIVIAYFTGASYEKVKDINRNN